MSITKKDEKIDNSSFYEEITEPEFMCSCLKHKFNIAYKFYNQESFVVKCPECGKQYGRKHPGQLDKKKHKSNITKNGSYQYEPTYEVRDDGIYKMTTEQLQYSIYTEKVEKIISKEAFIEAFNKYLGGKE